MEDKKMYNEFEEKLGAYINYLDQEIKGHLEASEFESLCGEESERAMSKSFELAKEKLFEIFPKLKEKMK